jgi:hypothetical protein
LTFFILFINSLIDVGERIDFAFQSAAFEFKGTKFSVPYPVPFKLLGDEAKGWVQGGGRALCF